MKSLLFRNTLFAIIYALPAIFPMNAMALCLADRRPSIEQESASSSFIVEALATEAKDITSPDDPEGIEATLYTVRVIRVFKGMAPKIITIRSENTSSRFNMDLHKKYLLFLTGSPKEGLVDNCGNSGAVKERKKEMAEMMPRIKKHR